MRVTVSGTDRRIPDAWRRETLLNALREHLGLVGRVIEMEGEIR